jgi:hypothetical protein
MKMRERVNNTITVDPTALFTGHTSDIKLIRNLYSYFGSVRVNDKVDDIIEGISSENRDDLGPLMNAAFDVVNAFRDEHGLWEDNPANRLVITDKMFELAKKLSIRRPRQVVPIAVSLAFIPNQSDVLALAISGSSYAKELRGIRVGGRGFSTQNRD